MTAIAKTIAAKSTASLVALYNELTGKSITKFQDRATAERRVTEVATPAALLAISYCPHCAGHFSSQTMAGKEGTRKGDEYLCCHECGAEYHINTGKLFKAAASSDDRSSGIAASWADPAVRAARSARHAVVVQGKGQFASVAKAFAACGLPAKDIIKTRGQLVAEGKAEVGGFKFRLAAAAN